MGIVQAVLSGAALFLSLAPLHGCDSPTDGGDAVESPPAPAAGDRILFDTRSSLQSATTTVQALALFVASTGVWSLSTDMDGSGRNALRLDHPGWDGATCTDMGGEVRRTLPLPRPKRAYFQWKSHLGRTATGGGLGGIGSFVITNGACGNAGAKRFLILRDVPDEGGQGRIDYVWSGPAPVSVRVEGWYSFAPNPGALFQNQPNPLIPENRIGEDVTYTLFISAESAPGAGDGIVRMWIDAALVLQHVGIPTGEWGFHRFQFPSTFRAPAQPQSEYFWDILAWEPVGS